MSNKTATMPSQTGSVSNRLPLREAINTTIDGCGIDDRALAQKAGIGYHALSEFRKGPREFTTKTIDYITGAFTKTEFYFFLEALEGDEGATANMPALDDNLIQHPAFNPLVSHVVKYCGPLYFHEILCLMVDRDYSIPESRGSTAPPPLKFFPARLGIREAFITTIDAFNFVTAELAERSGVAAPGLSSFRTNRREMLSRTMDQILATFSTEQYLYFTGVFRGAVELLEEADPTLAWPQYQDDPEHQYRAFCTLLSRAATQCTIDQFDDLFRIVADSRAIARHLEAGG
ncbi:MAG: hypothetical protein AAFQ57_01265 [Cyanobacteria bacterium J06626_14]